MIRGSCGWGRAGLRQRFGRALALGAVRGSSGWGGAPAMARGEGRDRSGAAGAGAWLGKRNLAGRRVAGDEPLPGVATARERTGREKEMKT